MTTEFDPTYVDVELDPLTQRMKGIARHGHTPFDVPYVSHVVGNIYQGGCSLGLELPRNIEYVISLYKWEHYIRHDRVKSFYEYTMYDSDDGIPERHILNDIVNTALDCVEEGPTLIHCQAGLNRSSLVAALVLMELGYTGKAAIELLRHRRSPAVLCNKTFERYVLNQDG